MELEFKVKSLTADDISGILSVAMTGNGDMSISYDTEFYHTIPENKRSGECFEDKCADVLLNGGKIKILDYLADGETYGNLESVLDSDDVAIYSVGLEDILNGMNNPQAQKYVMDFVNEEDDFYSGYNLIQIILFGELVYG